MGVYIWREILSIHRLRRVWPRLGPSRSRTSGILAGKRLVCVSVSVSVPLPVDETAAQAKAAIQEFTHTYIHTCMYNIRYSTCTANCCTKRGNQTHIHTYTSIYNYQIFDLDGKFLHQTGQAKRDKQVKSACWWRETFDVDVTDQKLYLYFTVKEFNFTGR